MLVNLEREFLGKEMSGLPVNPLKRDMNATHFANISVSSHLHKTINLNLLEKFSTVTVTKHRLKTRRRRRGFQKYLYRQKNFAKGSYAKARGGRRLHWQWIVGQ